MLLLVYSASIFHWHGPSARPVVWGGISSDLYGGVSFHGGGPVGQGEVDPVGHGRKREASFPRVLPEAADLASIAQVWMAGGDFPLSPAVRCDPLGKVAVQTTTSLLSFLHCQLPSNADYHFAPLVSPLSTSLQYSY